MPIITISRGTFSGGKDLAEQLARELGCPCVSREVIAEAAEHYGASQGALSAALEQAPSLIDRLKRDRDRYLAYIRAELFRHARRGDFVYHGHAGHHLLAGVRHVLRVRVVADLSYRVREAMARLNMTSRQAEAHIKEQDEQRRKWTQFLYGVAWEDASNYDAVLNLEYLGIAGARTSVLCLARLEQFQATPESRQALENLALQSLVVAALAKDERTRDGDFRVKADRGVITVEGVVKVRDVAEAVREVVGGVEGVKEVVDDVVSPSFLV
jgi:cytidylate kinase